MRATKKKKLFDLFSIKLMRATKINKQEKHSWKKNNYFLELFFYLPKFNVISRKSATRCARWADKKHMVFLVMLSLNLMRAQRKNIVALPRMFEVL